MNLKPRNYAQKARQLLSMFPVLLILGARQVGKTVLAKSLAPDWDYFDLEKPAHYDRISHDPSLFFEQHPEHIIIDEAQELPVLFNVLRGVIDQRRQQRGRFIITGSSSLELLEQSADSLAGRIAILEIANCKINEYCEQPLSPFYNVFEQTLDPKLLPIGPAPLASASVQKLWLKGGYLEPLLHKEEGFHAQWMANYHSSYIFRDIAKLFPNLNKLAYRRFLTIVSQLSATILNKSNIARSIEVSQKTVTEYLKILENTYLWQLLPSFEKNITKTIVKMPKGYLRDTGLLHYLLGIQSYEPLYNHPLVGQSFESFVIEEIIKGLQATMVTNWHVHYYRTRKGAEVDLIIEGPFGILPIEIKHSSFTPINKLSALSNFIQTQQLPFGLLINQSQEARWLSRQILQIPVGWL